jgi:hypothetical protein
VDGRRAGLVTIMMLTAASCSSGAGHLDPRPGAPAATKATTPPTATPPATYGGAPGVAEREGCDEEVHVAQEASDAYAAENGRPAASLAALVSAGLLRTPGQGHGYVLLYVPATGKVSAEGACTT